MNLQRRLRNPPFIWNGYREFMVHDPKARRVMAAPFLDRVIHHAIHQVVQPTLESNLDESVYACRKGKGSRKAVIDLCHAVRSLGADRFCMKLDVRKYFESIDHALLMSLLSRQLPDSSIDDLLRGLLANHSVFAERGFGIPIGNLTSQLFANIYLASADRMAKRLLQNSGYYCRYMDDLVLVGKDKTPIRDATAALIEHVEKELKLTIPFHKRMPLGSDPIPFLGFVVHHDGHRILSRNQRRYAKRLKRLEADGERPSRIAQANQSHESWKDLALGRMHL